MRAVIAGVLLLASGVVIALTSAAAATTTLYPDLTVLPPRDLKLATVNVSNDPNVTRNSRVLQFSNTQMNVGQGQLDLRAHIDTSLNPPSGPATQRVYDSAGSYTDYSVGSMYYHAVHQHYHYEGWGRYELWTKANWDSYVASGRTSTPNPLIGTKTTSCVLDEEFVQQLPGTPYPGTNTGSGCTLDASHNLREGLSPGWGDTYDWYRFEQWVDLGSASATLADGQYVVRSIADPDNQLYESAGKSDSARESVVANEAMTVMTVSGGQIVDTQAPTGSISLNGVDESTSSTSVNVAAVGRDDVSGVDAFRLSNDGTTWAQRSYTTSGSVPTTGTWSLTDPAYGGTSTGGVKTVYAQFHDRAGRWGPTTTATISLPGGTPSPSPTPTSTAAPGSYSATVLADSPSGYWRLGESSGSTMADATGRLPGSYTAGVTLGRPSLVPSQTDTATAAGSTGVGSVPNNATLSPARLSVEAWFRADTLPTSGQWASLVTKSESWSLQFNGPRLEFTLIDSSGTRGRLQAPAGAVVAGTAYHVVGTWDGSTQRLYLNGTQVASLARTTAYRTTSDALRLGSWDGGSEFLRGTLDDVAVYPTALTATQVSNHRTAGTSTSTTTSTARTASYPLTVTLDGTGLGRVRSRDGLLDCTTTCTVSYPADSTVTLDATPATGSVFAGWGGACGGTSASCVVSTYAATSATATFSSSSTPATLRVTVVGGGAVSSSPAGITCGTSCTLTLPVGTSVTLTAAARTGSTFVAWAGACTGATTSCTLVVTRDSDVSATFDP